jgi:hypothetical protein
LSDRYVIPLVSSGTDRKTHQTSQTSTNRNLNRINKSITLLNNAAPTAENTAYNVRTRNKSGFSELYAEPPGGYGKCRKK